MGTLSRGGHTEPYMMRYLEIWFHCDPAALIHTHIDVCHNACEAVVDLCDAYVVCDAGL